jgi:hypothetical protein
MNARGGPGIVLATVAIDAGIIGWQAGGWRGVPRLGGRSEA